MLCSGGTVKLSVGITTRHLILVFSGLSSVYQEMRLLHVALRD